MKRRADVPRVGLRPPEDRFWHLPRRGVIARLVGAILLEQTDEWQLQHRDMTLETMGARIDEQPATLTHVAARSPSGAAVSTQRFATSLTDVVYPGGS